MATGRTMTKELHAVDRQKYILPDDVAGPHKTLSSSRSLSLANSQSGSGSNEASSRSTRNQSPTPTIMSPDPDSNDGSTADPSKAVETYFNPFNLRRVESMSTLSRASFSSQLSQLASLKLPQAASLASTISAMPAAAAAARALSDAAEQIRDWIQKAAQVLGDLDAEDDVEWAAAGGREGLGEVDSAVKQFEGLVKVYVGAIDELRARKDISTVPVEQQKSVVAQMETALDEWEGVGKSLKLVKQQVELAMEHEELLNVVLGDIGLEIEELAGLVFEMEEKRHRSLMDDMAGEGADNLDIGELETIVEEAPMAALRINGPTSRGVPASAGSPLQSPTMIIAQDDSTYLALFARMQPLRASLDFLPMRLSAFLSRAETIFPSACRQLQSRSESLDEDFKELQKDADALRKELGEDRWVLVFRNAGRQAQKMCQLVSRSVIRLREAIDAGTQHTNPSSMAKKVESYETKKMHYGPAIERVLAIIERGVQDRLTVNGEILRLRREADAQWRSLEEELKAMDADLEALNLSKNQQLRDSISTIISLDRSVAGSTADTPGSSPASSIVMTGSNGGYDPTTPLTNAKLRPHNSRASSLPRPKGGDRRHSSLPQVSALTMQPPRKTTASRLSSTPVARDRTASPSRYLNRSSATPTPALLPTRPLLGGADNKPRWNTSSSTRDSPTGHNFKPLTLTTPSPHRKAPPTRSSSSSVDGKPPYGSPLSRDRSESPGQASPSLRNSVYGTNRVSAMSPAPTSMTNLHAAPRQPLRARVSASQLAEVPSARPRMGRIETVGSTATAGQSTPARPKVSRPASAMASGRRSSLLPLPKASPVRSTTTTTTSTGRDSVAATSRDRSSLLLRPSSRLSASGRASPAVSRSGDPAKPRPAWR